MKYGLNIRRDRRRISRRGVISFIQWVRSTRWHSTYPSLPDDVTIQFIDSVPKLYSAVIEMQQEAVLGWDFEFSHGNNVFCTVSLIQVAGQKKM